MLTKYLLLIVVALLVGCTSEEAPEDEPPPEITEFRVVSGLGSNGDDFDDDGNALPPMTTCRLTPLFGTLAILRVDSEPTSHWLGGEPPPEEKHVCNPEDYGWKYTQVLYRATDVTSITHIVGDQLPASFELKSQAPADVPVGTLLLAEVYELRGEYFVQRWGYEIEPATGGAVQSAGDRRVDFPTDVASLRQETATIRNSPPATCPDGYEKPYANEVRRVEERFWFTGSQLEVACERFGMDVIGGPEE